jgi:type IV pilus assembly protein PilN
VIERLEKGKLGPVRVLDELSTNIPKRVWITSFREKEGDLSLRGTGLENADISEFMRALQKSKFFDNVRLKYTQSTSQEGVLIYKFEITAKVNYAA